MWKEIVVSCARVLAQEFVDGFAEGVREAEAESRTPRNCAHEVTKKNYSNDAWVCLRCGKEV